MNTRASVLVARVISVVPFSFVRCMLYRALFHYSIYRTTLGFGVVIAVENADFRDSSIGKFTTFLGPISVSIEGARIGGHNSFGCGNWVEDASCGGRNYERTLKIERDAMITSHHYFDIAGRFTLCAHSWIGGCGSQFWTHGADRSDRDCNINIGRHCYIASAVRFAPGTQIADNTLVGLGSVLTKRFVESNVMIAGVPARIVKRDYDWASGQAVNGSAPVEESMAATVKSLD